MSSVDDLKRERDGQLTYGPQVDFWKQGFAPKTTRIGRDAEGNIVATGRSFGPHTGEIIYGRSCDVETWETTEAGERLYRERGE